MAMCWDDAEDNAIVSIETCQYVLVVLQVQENTKGWVVVSFVPD